jgi:hypothetical protein
MHWYRTFPSILSSKYIHDYGINLLEIWVYIILYIWLSEANITEFFIEKIFHFDYQ